MRTRSRCMRQSFRFKVFRFLPVRLYVVPVRARLSPLSISISISLSFSFASSARMTGARRYAFWLKNPGDTACSRNRMRRRVTAANSRRSSSSQQNSRMFNVQRFISSSVDVEHELGVSDTVISNVLGDSMLDCVSG